MVNKFLIKNPIVSEKAVQLGRNGKYIFKIADNANAVESAKAIEANYNVKVVKTNVINVKSKRRRLGRTVGVKPGYKKLIVTLAKGQKLDILPE